MKYTFSNGEIEVEGEWPKTKKGALNESIKKWKQLVVYMEEDKNDKPYAAINSCALCQIYYDRSTIGGWMNSECKGCPVAESTGEGECGRTPYIAYINADNHGQALRAARREVRFLESLK